jgi:hypothetical protein
MSCLSFPIIAIHFSYNLLFERLESFLNNENHILIIVNDVTL